MKTIHDQNKSMPFVLFGFILCFFFFFIRINYCSGDFLCFDRSSFSLGGDEGTSFPRIFWYYLAHDGITHFIWNIVLFCMFFYFFETEENGVYPLVVFLSASLFSGLAYLFLDPCADKVSVVGASGGVSGLMGSFLIIKLEKRIHFFPFSSPLFKKGISPLIIRLFIMLCILYSIYSLLERSNCEGVSNSIHLTGFIIGIIASLCYMAVKKYMRQKHHPPE